MGKYPLLLILLPPPPPLSLFPQNADSSVLDFFSLQENVYTYLGLVSARPQLESDYGARRDGFKVFLVRVNATAEAN